VTLFWQGSKKSYMAPTESGRLASEDGNLDCKATHQVNDGWVNERDQIVLQLNIHYILYILICIYTYIHITI